MQCLGPSHGRENKAAIGGATVWSVKVFRSIMRSTNFHRNTLELNWVDSMVGLGLLGRLSTGLNRIWLVDSKGLR